jgi:hypothetical protein
VTLVSHVTTAELNRSLRTPPESMAAYDFYLQARAEMRHSIGLDHGTQLASIMKARDLLRRSLEADPRFAGAPAALAGTYVRSWRERLNDEYRQPSTLDRALEYGDRPSSSIHTWPKPTPSSRTFCIGSIAAVKRFGSSSERSSSTRISPTAAMD